MGGKHRVWRVESLALVSRQQHRVTHRQGRFAHIRRINKDIPVVRCLYDGGTVYLQDNEYETPRIVEPVKLD